MEVPAGTFWGPTPSTFGDDLAGVSRKVRPLGQIQEPKSLWNMYLWRHLHALRKRRRQARSPRSGGPWSSVGSPKNVGSTPDSASGGPRGGVAAQCPRSGLMGAAGMRRGLPSVRPKSLKDVARRRRSGGRCGRDAGPLAPVPRALRSVGSPRFRARLRCVFPGPRARLAMARSRGVAAARPSPSRRRARACARSAVACR